MWFSSVLDFRRVEGPTETIPTQRLSFIFRLFFLSLFLSFFLSFIPSFLPSSLIRFALLRCERNLMQILLIPGASQLDYVISGDGSVSVEIPVTLRAATLPQYLCTQYNQAEPPTRRREKTATTRNFSVMRVDNSQARTLTPIR